MESWGTLAGVRIAVIEDDITLRESLAIFLRVKGCLVETFGCAEDAIGAVVLGKFGVVISDFILPGEDGISVLRRARGASKTVATMLISGQVSMELWEKTRLAGIDSFLPKPFSTVELEDTLQQMIDKGCGKSGDIPEASA